MARDLALPPVASPPMHSGTNSSESHNHRPQGTRDLFVEPPSPDRVEMSSSEESDDLDGGEIVEEAEQGEQLYRQFLARRMAEERLMDEGVSLIDVRKGFCLCRLNPHRPFVLDCLPFSFAFVRLQ